MLAPPPDTYVRSPELGFLIRQFWQRVLELNARYPQFVPTSWWRSVEDNGRVGGDPLSQHLLALAVDEDAPGSSELFEPFARDARAGGLVAVLYPSHVHIQLLPKEQNPLRRQAAVRQLVGLPETALA